MTTLGMSGAIVGADAVRKLYAHTNKVHSNGTLLTRHLTTNAPPGHSARTTRRAPFRVPTHKISSTGAREPI